MSGFLTPLLLGLLVSLGCAGAPASSPAPSPSPPGGAPAQPELGVVDFGLGPGDELEVQVFGHPDLERTIRIPPDFVIFYPLVGEIDVRGKGVRELRRQITEGLDRYVVDPQVSLEVKTRRSLKVYVLGEVRAPSVLPVDGEISALEAIVRAGGFTRNAGRGSVIRIRAEGDGSNGERIDLSGTLKSGEADSVAVVRPGDVLYVPPSFVANMDRFFQHVVTALGPILAAEQSIILFKGAEQVIQNRVGRETSVIVPAGQ